MISTDQNLQAFLVYIHAQSSSIHERLNQNWIADISEANDSHIKEYLELWCNIVAKGDWGKFKQRLAFDNLTIEKISSVLGAQGKYPANTPFPSWINTLKQIIETASQLEFSQIPDNILNSVAIPFEPIYFPFCQVAWNQFNQLVNYDLNLLSEKAQLVLQKQLINQLACIC